MVNNKTITHYYTSGDTEYKMTIYKSIVGLGITKNNHYTYYCFSISELLHLLIAEDIKNNYDRKEVDLKGDLK